MFVVSSSGQAKSEKAPTLEEERRNRSREKLRQMLRDLKERQEKTVSAQIRKMYIEYLEELNTWRNAISAPTSPDHASVPRP